MMNGMKKKRKEKKAKEKGKIQTLDKEENIQKKIYKTLGL